MLSLNEISQESMLFVGYAKQHVSLVGKIIFFLWLINFINWKFLRSSASILGIVPRKLYGCLGIIFAPLWHRDWSHLLFNILPGSVLMLLTLTYLGSIRLFVIVSLLLSLGQGLLTWLVARPGLHIGASGLVMAYFGFCLLSSYYNPGVHSVIVASIALYYFSNMIFSIFPDATQQQVSWESHFCGFISGIVMAYLINNSWFLNLIQ